MNALTRFAALCTLAACFGLSASPHTVHGLAPRAGAQAGEVLTNASVIELVQAGLGDALVAEKIRRSECRFDMSVAGLKQLKAAKVSEAVIAEMFSRQRAATAAGGVPTPPPSSPGAHSVVTPGAGAAGQLLPETKDELRRPPQITIRGDVEAVRAALLKHFLATDGATLVRESQSQVVFRREPKGVSSFLGQLYYKGHKPYNLLTFTLTAAGGEVLVVADTDIAVTDGRGVEHRVGTANDNKKYRQALREEMAALKARVETVPPAPIQAAPQPQAPRGPTAVTSSPAPAPGEMDDVVEFEVPLGRTVKGFTYAPRRLSYRGRAFRLSAALAPEVTPKFRISLNETRHLAAAIAVDTDGQSPAFVLDLSDYSVIEPRGWAAQQAYWSPSGRYVLFHCAYEGERFVGVDLKTRKVTEGAFLSTQKKVWSLYADPRWLPGRDVLVVQVKEQCNPYENARCTGDLMNRVLAVRELHVDATTLKHTFRR
jgi:hypothetical protein